MNACSACAQREAFTSVRDHGMGGVDITLGLEDLGGRFFACPECGQRYERTEELAEPPYMFQDYDMYSFRKLEPVLSRAKPPPASPPAPPLVSAEVARLASPGCASCGGVDAPKAWASLHGHHVVSLVREVHFGIDVKRCACNQPWVVVFTERVDHLDGNDDQTWLAVPVTDAEVSVLTSCDRSRVPRGVVELGRDRRFLLRSNALPEIAWRDSGFGILPHS